MRTGYVILLVRILKAQNTAFDNVNENEKWRRYSTLIDNWKIIFEENKPLGSLWFQNYFKKMFKLGKRSTRYSAVVKEIHYRQHPKYQDGKKWLIFWPKHNNLVSHSVRIFITKLMKKRFQLPFFWSTRNFINLMKIECLKTISIKTKKIYTFRIKMSSVLVRWKRFWAWNVFYNSH